MGFWEKLMKIDRRIIFLFVIIAVTLPLFLDISQKTTISTEVQRGFDVLAALQPNARVLIPCDYDPPSAPELQPMSVAAIRYCLDHDLRMIIMGLWPQGPQQANAAFETVLGGPLADTISWNGKTLIYGRDWVNLGFQAGNELIIQRMGSSIPAAFPRDYRGTAITDLPLMQGVQNFNNIDFVINISAGYPGIYEWTQFGVDRFGVKLFGGTTAVQAPLVYPYFGSGQLKGLMGGLKGASEFEELAGTLGKATKFMLSQSFAHVIVIFFIIVGNVAYFAGGRRKKTS
ncbi:hypothetical protein ACFLQW_02850 [Candidatus Zixiibacteriota bacterium]